jgi:hypothetical protein
MVERDTHEQKLEYYRQQIAASHVALKNHRLRHNELLRLFLEEAGKDDPIKPLYDT